MLLRRLLVLMLQILPGWYLVLQFPSLRWWLPSLYLCSALSSELRTCISSSLAAHLTPPRDCPHTPHGMHGYPSRVHRAYGSGPLSTSLVKANFLKNLFRSFISYLTSECNSFISFRPFRISSIFWVYLLLPNAIAVAIGQVSNFCLDYSTCIQVMVSSLPHGCRNGLSKAKSDSLFSQWRANSSKMSLVPCSLLCSWHPAKSLQEEALDKYV